MVVTGLEVARGEVYIVSDTQMASARLFLKLAQSGSAGLCLLAAQIAVAGSTNGSWSLQTWRAVDGLPDNTVVGLEQTADGFLWVGTQGGLVRFDGVRFQEFSPVTAAGEPTSFVQAMFLDRRNRLWIGKDRGVVVCVEPGKTTAFTASNGLPRMEVRLILEDAQGDLWISYIGGEVVRIHDGQIRGYRAEGEMPDGGTCQITADANGRLWYAKGNEVGVIREGRFVTVRMVKAQRLCASRQGGVWIGVATRLSRMHPDGRVEACGVLPTDRPNVTPTVLFEDRTGAVWIGTRNGGLFRYDRDGFTSVRTSHHEISSVLEDREGNIWVGTRGGGLNRLRPSIAEVMDVPVGVPGERIRSVCQDTAGTIWAITQLGLVTRLGPEGWSAITARQGWPEQYAQCITADPAGGVWIGTQYKGLHLWSDGAVRTNYSLGSGPTGNGVTALLQAPNGDLWVGTESSITPKHDVMRRRAGQWQVFDLPAESGQVNAMVTDASNQLWVATSAGRLLRFGEDQFVDETRKTLEVPHAIRCLLGTADGSLWIGYAGRGVGRLKAGQFTLYHQEQGLPEDYISQLIADQRGRIWCAGNRRIFYVTLTDFDAVTRRETPRVRAVVFGRNEGLPGTQASYGFWPGALHGADGKLWIPMQSGLTVIHTTNLKLNPVPPPVSIERVMVDGQAVGVHEFEENTLTSHAAVALERKRGELRVRVKPGYQRLMFEFTALSFIAPANVEFKYRLHGLEEDWVDARQQRVAEYPHIPPGDYRFEVMACNDAGVWSNGAVGLAVTAEPHFWQARWFQVAAPVLGFLLVGAVVLRSVRERHRRQIERLEMQRATERERARIAQDLHDDLGAGLTQISLNTALAQNPAVASDLASGLLTEIDNRARELVLALDEIVWAVQPKNDSVPSLARYLCQFAQGSLQPANMACRLDVAQSLPSVPVSAEQRHQLFLAFKEALHNTIQHSGATEVRLAIAADRRTFTVTLADNGRGFVPGTRTEGADGLENMRLRLARLGGRCDISSAVQQGTTVVFRLSLAESNGA